LHGNAVPLLLEGASPRKGVDSVSTPLLFQTGSAGGPPSVAIVWRQSQDRFKRRDKKAGNLKNDHESIERCLRHYILCPI